LATGEDAEFTALVHRQSRFVFRVAYAILRNSHNAEDAAQETFLKLYLNRGWQQVDNERAFLARVTWRVALDKIDKAGRQPQPASQDESDAADELPSSRPGPETVVLQANQHAMVHAMIDALPEELRQPLALSAVDELNSSEIGQILGIPEGTVRTRLQRARQVLRQKLTALEEARYAR
jgi:RNA polymerase sigma-70 factor (ECF subfamily)